MVISVLLIDDRPLGRLPHSLQRLLDLWDLAPASASSPSEHAKPMSWLVCQRAKMRSSERWRVVAETVVPESGLGAESGPLSSFQTERLDMQDAMPIPSSPRRNFVKKR